MPRACSDDVAVRLPSPQPLLVLILCPRVRRAGVAPRGPRLVRLGERPARSAVLVHARSGSDAHGSPRLPVLCAILHAQPCRSAVLRAEEPRSAPPSQSRRFPSFSDSASPRIIPEVPRLARAPSLSFLSRSLSTRAVGVRPVPTLPRRRAPPAHSSAVIAATRSSRRPRLHRHPSEQALPDPRPVRITGALSIIRWVDGHIHTAPTRTKRLLCFVMRDQAFYFFFQLVEGSEG